MLKTSKAAIAAILVAGSASAAFAGEAFDVDIYHGNPNASAIYATQDARGAYAYAPRAVAGQNARVVYENGQYVGTDPDASIRLNLEKESSAQ